MSISSWLPSTFSRSQARRGQRRNSVSRPKTAHLFLEHLEGRALLSSYTAGSVSDLITDINAANAAGGANTISLTAATTSPYVLTAMNNNTGNGNGLPVIAANDNLTIVGNGDTIERSTASGTARFRLFDVARGASLTLQNLTLQGGLVQAWLQGLVGVTGGGAIYNQGALTLSGVTVVKNMVAGGSGYGSPAGGGGIWSSGSLTLDNGTLLEGNVASGGSAGLARNAAAFGGAVYVAGGTANITNTTFTGNSAIGGPPGGGTGGNAFGGALYVAAGQVILTTTTVNNNSAIQYYGPATAYGGGVYVAGGTVALAGDTVESNTIRTEFGGYGGGLYVAGGTVTLTSDTVEFNSAYDGGGLYVADGTVTLTSDTVESNGAGCGGGQLIGYGGGLCVAGGTVTLTSDTVESNSAGYGGGLFIAQGAIVYIDAFTLAHVINNTAAIDPNIDGTYIKT